jgi:hypothetical protein
MENKRGPAKLRGLGAYLKKTVKFYELKNERLSRMIFIIILSTSFLGIFIPEEGSFVITGNLLGITVAYMASAVYLAAYIKDLKNEEYSLKTCFVLVARNFFKIIFSSVAFLIGIVSTVGLLAFPELIRVVMAVFLIPLIIAYVMFLFNTCYIVDKGYGISQSYKSSKNITSGYKRAIFIIILLFNFIMAIPMSIVLLAASSVRNIFAANFILSFAAAVLNLMQQRLTALIYMDLEYGEKS